ncbi:hypothetical protein QBC37DRAFT_394886 [Rhypophila decipiens]|uniref:Uncharacterized protein n=1 Tax=Rhypophila decipiens TaxID=261697 RepID=A0AAN7BAX7_9PEZI|nr:hypothetical protein QBC37DRAFT_394886 [Rhypophila decipiens]
MQNEVTNLVRMDLRPPATPNSVSELWRYLNRPFNEWIEIRQASGRNCAHGNLSGGFLTCLNVTSEHEVYVSLFRSTVVVCCPMWGGSQNPHRWWMSDSHDFVSTPDWFTFRWWDGTRPVVEGAATGDHRQKRSCTHVVHISSHGDPVLGMAGMFVPRTGPNGVKMARSEHADPILGSGDPGRRHSPAPIFGQHEAAIDLFWVSGVQACTKSRRQNGNAKKLLPGVDDSADLKRPKWLHCRFTPSLGSRFNNQAVSFGNSVLGVSTAITVSHR